MSVALKNFIYTQIEEKTPSTACHQETNISRPRVKQIAYRKTGSSSDVYWISISGVGGREIVAHVRRLYITADS